MISHPVDHEHDNTRTSYIQYFIVLPHNAHNAFTSISSLKNILYKIINFIHQPASVAENVDRIVAFGTNYTLSGGGGVCEINIFQYTFNFLA